MSGDDIYERIYDIDISEGSGIRAITPYDPNPPSEEEGYIIVNETMKKEESARSFFPKVVIPESKQKSYDLAKTLFDNYNLRTDEVDVITDSERAEMEVFLKFVVNRPPMILARKYIEGKRGSSVPPFTDEEWYALVEERWFRMFKTDSGIPTRSGFEHVFLGEWRPTDSGQIVGGLHWWYFFLVNIDNMSYRGAQYDESTMSGLSYPIVATLQFLWHIPGQEEGDPNLAKLYKHIGGFFVGVSVEGLMAMGMVRASQGAPSSCTIDGGVIDLPIYKSPDERSIITFFPILQKVLFGVLPPPPAPEETTTTTTTTTEETATEEAAEVKKLGLRILSIVPNPDGNDVGKEKVTLMYMFGDSTCENINLSGWKVVGPNKSALTFGDTTLLRGEARTFVLSGKGSSLQFTNKGGDVSLIQPDGKSVEQVLTYTKDMARISDGVLIWNGADNLVVYNDN